MATTSHTSRTSRTARTRTGTPKKAAPRRAPVKKIPAQRASEIDNLGLRVEELEVDTHAAQDDRLFAALEWAAR